MRGEGRRQAPSPLSGFHLCVFSTGCLSQCCQLLPGSPCRCQLPPAGSDPGLRASWQHLPLLSSQPVGFLLLLISESQCGSYLFFQQSQHVTALPTKFSLSGAACGLCLAGWTLARMLSWPLPCGFPKSTSCSGDHAGGRPHSLCLPVCHKPLAVVSSGPRIQDPVPGPTSSPYDQ